jgi:parallel beta-helix repeat protein
MLKISFKILVTAVLLLQSLISLNSKPKEYFIECNPDDFDYIYKHPYDDIYIPITFTYNGKTWDNVSLRIRGDDTRMHPKKSLKVKFDGEKFENGRDKLNFNAEYEDPTYICQYLATRTFKRAGYPCFDAEHARLYMNGKYLGLYLRIENMDADFLEDKALDRNGNLYKATEDDASLSIYDDVYTLWEKKTNESTGREDLQQLIDSLFYTRDKDYYNFAHRMFHYNKMIDILAINMLLANGSTYYHNYYMYHDIYNTGKWMMFPWDMDKTFFMYGYLRAYHRGSSHNSPDNPFFERAIICEPIFNDIRNRINELSEEFFNNDYFDPVIDSLENDIRSSVAEDNTDAVPDADYWYEHAEKNKLYVTERYNRLQFQFDNWPRAFKTEPTMGIYSDSVRFIWHPSYHPMSKEITYNFHFGSKENLEDTNSTTIIRGLRDTAYLKTDLPPDGDYYWKVVAYDGTEYIDGFDYPNHIKIKKATKLSCNINTETVLTKEGSPYKISCDLLVSSNLTIEPGVILLVDENKKITITGNLTVNGTKDQPVIIEPSLNGLSWDMVYVSGGSLILKNCILNDGVIQGENALVEIDNVKFKSRYKDLSGIESYIFIDGGNVRFENSSIESDGICEGIRLKDCDAYTANCTFNNAPDAIEYINVKSGVIKDCSIYNANDDGIDINNCDDIQITGNFIVNAADKGISVGNEEVGASLNALIKRNIISNCNIGIAVKDSSEAIILNNTLYNNKKGIHIYEKFLGLGGGFAVITNSIITNSETSIEKDEHSLFVINYSLNDTQLYEGDGNIKANPMFINPDNFDFRLLPGSPCINAGNPNTEPDPDGTRADIGAIPTGIPKDLPKIVINEINYKSSDDFDSGDWVEFYNADDYDIDMSQWVFMDGSNDHKFMFPPNLILKKDEYLVLCRHNDRFSNIFPNVANYIGEFDFGFSSDGELLRLYDNNDIIIDSLTYGVSYPWTDLANGKGHSLELKEPLLDNSLPENWTHSENLGTPGEKNGPKTGFLDHISDCDLQIYPNPFDEKAKIIVLLNESSEGRIDLFDCLGKKIKTIFIGKLVKGKNEINFDLNNSPTGIYYCIFVTNNFTKTFVLSYFN